MIVYLNKTFIQHIIESIKKIPGISISAIGRIEKID